MKKYAFVLSLTLLFVVSASVVVGQSLVSPWLLHRDAASTTTQVFVYNSSSAQQTCNFTLRKVLEPSTSTTGSVVIPAKSTKVIVYSNYIGFITSGYPNDELPADGKYATLEILNPDAYFLGFTFRYKFVNNAYELFYSEPLLAWPMYVDSGMGGYN